MSPTRLHNVNALEIQAVVTRLASVSIWEDDGASYRQPEAAREDKAKARLRTPPPPASDSSWRVGGMMMIAASVAFVACITTLFAYKHGLAAGGIFIALPLAILFYLLRRVAIVDHEMTEAEIQQWREAYHAALRYDSRTSRKPPPFCPDNLSKVRRSE